MRSKASDVETEGIIEGAGMGVQGTFNLLAATQDPKSATFAKWQAAGQLGEGTAKVCGAHYAGSAAQDDAAAAEERSRAEHTHDAVRDEGDDAKSADQLVGAAIDFYREYSSTEAQVRNAAIHRA
jgi:hypothetical protein